MNRLTHISLAAAIVSISCAIALGFALINEGRERSAAVQAVYKIGLKDGEAFTRGQMIRAKLIEEAKAHIAEEKL